MLSARRPLNTFLNRCSTKFRIISSCSRTQVPKILLTTTHKHFSTTPARAGRGSVDAELATKLASEFKIETEMREESNDEAPPAIQEFLKNGPFKVTDTRGSDEVVLERKFGNEKIRIVFSVSDLNGFDPEESATSFEDSEEGAEVEAGGASVQGQGTSEDGAAREGAEDEADPSSFPVRCHITVSKEGTDQVLSLETTTQDGIFIIDNMTLYPSSKLALGATAESDWLRRERYMGPPFSNLDEDLQILMERWLEERGVNTSLALFVPDYVDYKEAREYTDWLSGLEKFIQV